MTTTVNRIEFLNALRALRPVVGGNPSLAILNNVAIAPQNGLLTLTATNLDVYAQRRVAFEDEALPAVTVPAKALTDFVGGFSGDTLKLDVDGTKLRITSGRQKATLAITDADEFPVFPALDSSNSTTITREEFDAVAGRVGSFAASDSARPILTGVQVQGNGERIRFAAADNYRVGVLYLDHQATLDIVVPAASLAAAQKVLAGAYVNFTTDGRQIMLTSESGLLLSRLIEGNYPNIDPILPTNFSVTLLISEDELAAAAKLASIANADIVKAEESEGGLRIFASDYDKEFDTTLDATYGLRGDEDKEDVRFSLNSKFVNSIAAVFSESTAVEIGYGGPLAPVAFRDPEDQTFRAVVMPVRTPS